MLLGGKPRNRRYLLHLNRNGMLALTRATITAAAFICIMQFIQSIKKA